MREIGQRFGPAVLGRGVVQLTSYLDLVLASLLATGALAALVPCTDPLHTTHKPVCHERRCGRTARNVPVG